MTRLKATIYEDGEVVATGLAYIFLDIYTNPLPTWRGEIETDALLDLRSNRYRIVLSDGREGNISIHASSRNTYEFIINEGFT